MALPKKAIVEDHRLEDAATIATDELMAHRWHWTLDKSNPNRVNFAEYARQVDRTQRTIRADAHGWAEWLAANAEEARLPGKKPGQAQTPNDYRALAMFGEEKRHAVEAIARTTGKSVRSISHKHEEVAAVISTARERAAERGTTVEHEIEHVAERRERGRQVSEKLKKEQKQRHTARYIAAEGDIGVAMQRLRKLLDDVEGVEFNDDERELLTDALGKLRALLN